MLVKHLLEALSALDPEIRVLTVAGGCPALRLETHWYVEWVAHAGDARIRNWDFHSRGEAARAQVGRVRSLGCSCISVEPVTSLVFA